MNRENSMGKISDSTKVQSLDDGKATSSHPHDVSSLNNMKSEEASAVSAATDKGTSTSEKNNEDMGNYVPPNIGQDEKVDKFVVDDHSYTSGAAFMPVHADPKAYTKDINYEPDILPQRIFHSERIPREQAELNRWSKSDDSSGPQVLMTHSRSDVSQHITESVDKLTDLNVTSNLEKVNAFSKSTFKDSPAVEEKVKESKKLTEDTDDIGATTSGVRDKTESSPKAELNAAVAPIGSKESALTPREMHRNKMNEKANEGKSQKLAQDDSRKDVSLMDQDHLSLSTSQAKFGKDTSMDYGYLPSEAGAIAADHVDSSSNVGDENQRQSSGPVRPDTMNFPSDYDISQASGIQSLQFNHPMTSRTAGSDSEDGKKATQPAGFPLVDFTLGDFDPSSLQIIKNKDLEELKELGSGTYGTVYHGKWRGTDVAIKRIKKSCFIGRSSEQERLTSEFWHEAEILSKLHHPNVVAFYGVVQDGPGGTLATVTEFMVNGSLRHALISKDRHLDRRKRLIIAMDAAFGMEYLHSRNIVHFDLKCDNLLVNLKDPSRPICKVGDFGLSKIKRNTLVTGGVRGTLPWMAPELLNGSSSKVSEKVDVFSFGIVLWEILTGEEPYANMHYGAIIGGIVNNILRPPVPSFCDPDWRLLMEQCWAPDPSARPSFTEIARRLRTMSTVTKPQGFPTTHNQSPK
ncbi:Tyrosine kinase [Handroanthus impetiginosus]|uniref:Tyrosine kinase n=1 Tax=Handroanthus impetiginosus TaxID=429701 RepID=A0A2G9I7D2_9LAMI|nr:Tyrosine kinase [Handroanthus impetiginosus]